MILILLVRAMLGLFVSVVGQQLRTTSSSSLLRPAAFLALSSSIAGVRCLAFPLVGSTHYPSLLKLASTPTTTPHNKKRHYSLLASPTCRPLSRIAFRGGSVAHTSLFSASTATATTAKQTTVSDTFAKPTMTMPSPSEKLSSLRKLMADQGIDIYLVPSDDPHLSEYTPDAYKRRGFLTNFHGSAGTAVVTSDKAFLWTDSRYWNEAGLCLDATCWTLQKQGLPSTPTIPKWLAEQAVAHYKQHKTPLRVGIDPYVHAASFPRELQTAFTETAEAELLGVDEGVDKDGDSGKNQDNSKSTSNDSTEQIGKLVSLSDNLVDAIWEPYNRPSLPLSPFRVHPLEYAGVSLAEKVELVRKEMQDKKVSLAVFCTLDDVAYLMNMRAKGDVDTCPVGIAYATVSTDEVSLYCESAKVSSPEVQEHLKNGGVTVKPYDAITTDITAHCSASKKNRVWLDKSRANFAISNVIPSKSLVDAQNAIVPMKACKNEAELQGMRQAHIVDGAAMANFMAWLEHTVVHEGRAVSEVEMDLKLTGYRAEQPGFLEVSFPTIAGVGSNGAIIHYRATTGTDLLKYLDTSNPILIDSGGQYLYGTTDVTRTWHFGQATAEFVDMYTRVLKGNIGLDMMIFPENTPGFVLDVYARRWLWEAGRDYGHGTGHGVGAALNVHEGPMAISPRWANKEVLKKGMVLSNEPGYYADGKFGIRIENLLEIQDVVKAPGVKAVEGATNDGTEASPPAAEKKFFKFAKLTLIPIQKNLIDINLMTKEELDWLDSYHEEVLTKVGPLLPPDSPALAWLQKSCEKINRNPQ